YRRLDHHRYPRAAAVTRINAAGQFGGDQRAVYRLFLVARALPGRIGTIVSADLNQLIPEFQPYAKALVKVVGSAGLLPQVTSTRRSNAEQQRLYDAYLARGASGLPAAPPGTSAHEFGYAFDLVVSPLAYLHYVGAYWQKLGGIWFPSDPVHFQYPGFTPPAVSDQVWRRI